MESPYENAGSGAGDAASEDWLWTPTRRELRAWFQAEAPSLAPAYEAAVRLTEGPAFPGRVNFIAHAVRDIGNVLPAVLEGETWAQVQYVQEFDKICKEWPFVAEPFNTGGDPVEESDIRIPRRVVLTIDELVRAHRASRKREGKMEPLLAALMSRQPADLPVSGRAVKALSTLHKRFVSRAHFRATVLPEVDDAEIRQKFHEFERVLHSFVGHFATSSRDLDAVLAAANEHPFRDPTSNQIASRLPLLSLPQHEHDFFDRLQNPRWIGPLKERGFFSHAPVKESIEGGGSRHPRWAASRFLARMAKEAPHEACEILADIETENLSVLRDTLDAAIALPAELASKLVPRICALARARDWMNVLEASELCARLARDGQAPSAMKLAAALFAPKAEASDAAAGGHAEYWYKEGLGRVVPALATAHARDFCREICCWLGQIVNATQPVREGSGDDLSYSWRPAVEEHAQNGDYDVAAILVGFARDALERTIGGDQLALHEGLKIVEKYSLLIFKRLRMHLINAFAEKDAELARRTMMDRALFDDFRFKHEYAMLMGQRFSMLSEDERAAWLGWVDEGPEMARWEERIREDKEREPTEEEKRGRADYWKFERLHWIRKHVDGARRKFYEDMFQTHGEPELADLNVRSDFGHWGAQSPITLDALKAKSFEQAVECVGAWEGADENPMGPDREGLAATFAQYVDSDAEGFSKQADVLKRRRPEFVQKYLDTMADAARSGRKIDVAAVIELCQWVVEQPLGDREDDEARGGVDELDRRKWSRGAAGRLCHAVCTATTEDKKARFGMEGIREAVWSVIKPLTRDPEKSNLIREISSDDPRAHDYLDLGINSPRGRAVEAALEYARWVAKQIKELRDGREVVPGGLGAMPEVRDVLEWQISPLNRTIEAMAVIGAHTGLLYWIDSEWLAANADRVFDLWTGELKPGKAVGWAAWNAYLCWVAGYVEYYRILKKQYAVAVEQASKMTMDAERREREQPMYRLGAHLVVLYGRGQLGLDDDGGVLRKFFLGAAADIRRYAIGQVGESLQRGGDVPAEVLQRFVALWELYWKECGEADARESNDGALFGAWFASGKFDEKWAIERLAEFAAVVPPEPGHLVAERLVKAAGVDVGRAVGVLDVMVRADRDGWRTQGWSRSAKEVLRVAMRAEDGLVRARARSIIDYLGRRGFVELGKLH